MKRLTKRTHLGLAASLGTLLILFPSCRRQEKEELDAIVNNLGEIKRDLRQIGQNLSRLQLVKAAPSFQLIDVTLSADLKTLQVPIDQQTVHLAKKVGHQVIWISRLNSPLKFEFKDAAKAQGLFPDLACQQFNKQQLCVSGPIKDYEKGDQCDPDDADARCFFYRICMPEARNAPCTPDPGIIIHP